MSKAKLNNHCGFVLLNKAVGTTTFRALRPIKNTFKDSRVGHAGTLDAVASGLVIVGVGQATRLLHYLEAESKLYTFKINLGQETNTCEAEGEVVAKGEKDSASLEELLKVLPQFTGKIEQAPPEFSAIKIDGKRASDRVMAGQKVVMKKRPVSIFSLEIIKEDEIGKIFSMRCHCSKGTYIRSLVRDIGRILTTRAYVTDIFREAIGDISVNDAVTPSDDVDLKNYLLPSEKLLPNISKIFLSERVIELLRNGVVLSPNQYKLPEKYDNKFIFIALNDEKPVDIYAEIMDDGRLIPRIRLTSL